MNSVIILAAGEGRRFDSNVPKQFHNLTEEFTVLEKNIHFFTNNSFIDELIIVVSRKWAKKINKSDKVKVVYGGNQRFNSSLNGLIACSSKCKNVLIHDAARPFVTNQIIFDCINALKEYDAVLPVISIEDSVLEFKNDKINYLNRENIKRAQTPQAFRYNKILNTYKKLSKDDYLKYSDDFSIFINYNKDAKFTFINGDKMNLKITYKKDIELTKKNII
tara:strand:+ start:1321 stop:1980 length:660 start_codon:yes stop_codon:yes gene_type:complete